VSNNNSTATTETPAINAADMAWLQDLAAEVGWTLEQARELYLKLRAGPPAATAPLSPRQPGANSH
jgi:hypothetical protein